MIKDLKQYYCPKCNEKLVKSGTKWKDRWGTIWTMIINDDGAIALWNKKTGQGRWDDGLGLEQVLEEDFNNLTK